jgi:hypothetical protein
LRQVLSQKPGLKPGFCLLQAARGGTSGRFRQLLLRPTGHSNVHERPHIDRPWIAAFAAAIALVCIVVLTLQIRYRWHSPEIQSSEQAEHATTGKVAHSAGARILPTDPPLSAEPSPAGPKQAQPANSQ